MFVFSIVKFPMSDILQKISLDPDMELVTIGSEIINLKQELNSLVEIPKIECLN